MALAAPNCAEPFHIMHVASGDLWAGAEVQLMHLMRALASDPAVRVTAVLLNDGQLAERLRAVRLPVRVVDESRNGHGAILRELIAVMRETRPDVVHTHRTKENVLGAIAAAVNRVPSIRTVHGAPEYPSIGAARRIVAGLDRMTGRRLQAGIVAVSSELQQRLAGTYAANRVVCIENGIHVESVRTLASEASAPTLAGGIRVGFMGRLVGVKRVDLFLESARAVLDSGSTDAHFYIVGDGPLRADLVAQAQRLDLTDRCHFLGFAANSLPLLRQMDALVLTSDHEGMPMVVLEALALGVPVVSHAVGGIPDVVASHAQGRLVYAQDPRVFADCIVEAVRDIPRGGDLLPPRFRIEHAAARYRDLYARVSKHRLATGSSSTART